MLSDHCFLWQFNMSIRDHGPVVKIFEILALLASRNKSAIHKTTDHPLCDGGEHLSHNVIKF
jgi:hypothetical protein